MLTVEPHTPDNVVDAHAHGKLTREDYEDFRLHVEQMVRQHGSARVLLELEDDFQGWDPGAAWDDLKLGWRYYGKFDRCAVLGNHAWEKWMVKLAAPFFRVQYFDRSRREEAWRWLMQPVPRESGWFDRVGGFIRRNPVLSLAIAGGLGALLVRRLSHARR
jgi:hypothetical protein